MATPRRDLRIGSYRQKNDTHGTQWFICNRKGIFNSPKQQVEKVGKARFAYLQLKYAGCLRRYISSHAACLRDGKWYEEQLTDDEANTDANADDDAGVDIVAKDTTTEPTNATPTATIQNHAAELREAAYRARCENAAAIVAEAAKFLG